MKQHVVDGRISCAKRRKCLRWPRSWHSSTTCGRICPAILSPSGTLVRLSSGEIAAVTHEHPTDPFRPQVKLVKDAHL